MAFGIGTIGVTTLIVIVSSVAAYRLAKFLRIYLLISKFQGPIAIPILGNTYNYKTDPREFFLDNQAIMEEHREKSGGLVRVWMGPVPSLVIYGAKHMDIILNSSRHIKKGYFYTFLEPWLGLGLLTSNGQKWFRRRKLLTPTFHFSILHNFLEVFNEQSAILVHKLETRTEVADPVNIFPLVTYCVLDIICDTAMGKHINAQGDSENDYVRAVKSMSEIVVQRAKRPLFWPDFIFERAESGRHHTKNLKILHDVTNKMIHERIKEPPRRVGSDRGESAVAGRRRRVAFLDLLLQMHRDDPTFTLEDIREEVDTFMFEGHDTTAAAISWAILLIGLHPSVQARVHEELGEVFGNSDRPVTVEDLTKLSYLTRVVKEALRLIPSVPIIFRELEEDIVIDGKTVPKETIIMLGIYALHQDPEQFPNPERFDPDRFLPENAAKRHPFAYVPFSAGPRNCIGQKFAMMEDKVVLANLLRKFSVTSLQSIDDAKPAGELIIRPVEGEILVKLTTRKESPYGH